jgi:antitoxin component YwqK of YwqJK toxin-antitoxin module
MEIEIRTGKCHNGVKWEQSYINGKKHGYTKGWYQNGNIWYETPYKNGICIGVGKSHTIDGRLYCMRTFKSKGIRDFFHGPKVRFKYGN